MRKNISLWILVMGLVTVVGCTKDTASPEKDIVLEQRVKFEIGDKEDSKKLIFTHYSDFSHMTRKVIFHIDAFPYSQTFDLCPELERETNKVIKEGKTTYKYVSKSATCPGYINVVENPERNRLLVSYKIILPEGYRTYHNHVRLPYKSEESVKRQIITKRKQASWFKESSWKYVGD